MYQNFKNLGGRVKKFQTLRVQNLKKKKKIKRLQNIKTKAAHSLDTVCCAVLQFQIC